MATPPTRRTNLRITDDKWKKYIKLISLNYSEVEAARKAQIAHSTVMLQKSKPTSNLNRVMAEMGNESAGLFTPDKVIGDAKRALEDFGYFRQRYFARSTSPWQEDAAMKILELASTGQKEYVVVNVSPGTGKDLALDTPLMTPTGWTTMGEVQVGDFVIDDQGLPTKVVAKSEVFTDHKCYEVFSDDGARVVAGKDHEWPVRIGGHGQYGSWKRKQDYEGKTGAKPSPDGKHLHTTESLAKPRGKRPQLSVAPAIDLNPVELPIEPYMLGVWLGDGHTTDGIITQSVEDSKWLVPEMQRLGFTVKPRKSGTTFGIKGFRVTLRDAGVLDNKHIPDIYFRSSIDQRLSLLQGLVDTDGSVEAGGMVEFCNTNYLLARGVQHLVHTLGVKASISESRAMLYGKDCGPRWRVSFYLQDAARLPRKRERTRNGVRTPHRYLSAVPTGTVATQCIQVDSPSHCYLAGEGLLVTHNSTFFAHDLPIWLAVKDRTRRTMIGSRTASQAQNYTGRIRKAFERSYLVKADAELLARGLAKDATGNLIADFGRFKPTNADRWRVDEFFLAQAEGVEIEDKEPNFASYGMDGDVLGNRFNFVIWDDLVDRTNTKTEDARDNLIQLWESAMENRLEPNGLLILQGQRIASNDLYRYALDQVEFNEFDMEDEVVEKKKIYHHIVYKAHYDELCGTDGAGKATHAGPWQPAIGNKPAKGCLLDPYRLPYKEIGRLKANRLNRFLLTYQQEDVDTEGSLIKQEWIDGGQDAHGVIHQGCWDEDRAIGRWPKGVDGYSVVTADPSPTKYWAVQWFCYNAETKNQYLIDLERSAMEAPQFLDWNNAEKCFTGLLEEWWLRSNDQGHPFTTLIFEANAAQRFLLQYDHFKRWSTLRGVTLVAHQTNRNKSNEDYGVQMLAPHYQAGRVRLPGGGTYLEGRAKLKPMIKELVQWPEGSTDDCHPEGTLIQTAKGVTPIEDVEVGELVLTHLGNWKPVEASGMRMEKESIYTIKSAGALPLQATGNHPILVVDGYRQKPTNKEIFDASKSEFVKAEELVGSKRHSSTPRALLTPFDTRITTPTFIDSQDSEFALLLGVYLAEGSTSDHAVHFSLNVKERVLADWLIKTMRHRYGCNVNEIIRGNGLSLVFQSVKAKLDFKPYGARTTKSLPNEVLTWPIALQRAILRGWMIGDGCFSNERFRGTSISPTLLSQMGTFGARLGAPSRLSIFQEPRSGFIQGRAFTSRRAYQLSFGHNGLSKILDPSSTLDIDRWGNFDLKEGKNMSMQVDTEAGYVIRKLKSVQKQDYNDLVYSLQVADDRSYIAEGVAVHNCVMAHWFLIWNAPNLFDYNNSTPPQFKRPTWMAGKGFRK